MIVTLGLVGIKMSNLAVGKLTPDDRLSFSILEASMNGSKYAKPNDVLNNCIAASQGKDINIATYINNSINNITNSSTGY